MKHKYEITVKQYQMFEFETYQPITEDDFWSDIYDIGNCEVDSNVVEWKETVEPTKPTTIVKTVEKKNSSDDEYVRKGLDVALELLSDADLKEWNARMEEEE